MQIDEVSCREDARTSISEAVAQVSARSSQYTLSGVWNLCHYLKCIRRR